MATRSGDRLERATTVRFRRAVLGHLIRQSGGPTADPRDAVRLAKLHYSLVPREARLGRFTARIARLCDSRWALDFNPEAPRLQLVCAIWHELSEILCLTDDLLSFDDVAPSIYRESATSAYDLRHLCAVGVERFVRRKLYSIPAVRNEHIADSIRRTLIARAATASAEPLLPSIERERWFDDENDPDGVLFSL